MFFCHRNTHPSIGLLRPREAHDSRAVERLAMQAVLGEAAKYCPGTKKESPPSLGTIIIEPMCSKTIIRIGPNVLVWAFLAASCAIQGAGAKPPSTRPVEGLRDHTPAIHALVGARIVVAPGRVLERGTIVVRDGMITAVGPEVAVPDDARVWELAGKTIYPGLIDAYVPEGTRPPEASGAPRYWNPLVRPERDMAETYRADKALNAALRSQGITCRLAVPAKGLIRGTSALVTAGDGPADRCVIKADVALHVRLRVDGGRRDYPKSPMGAVALVRQAFYDADWYRRAWRAYRADRSLPRPEWNVSLACLGEYLEGDRLVILDARDEQDFLRADRLAREFALRAAVRGSGREYRRLEAIRATGRTVIVPLRFPEPPDVSSPEAAMNVPLRDLLHWDIAPENPARLAAADVKIVLTSDGLSSRKEFLQAVRKAIRRGLSPEVALAALTTEPARLFGVGDRIGTIEAGKAAHLVVVDGDLFGKKCRILHTWVDGQPYEVAPEPPIDVRGRWRVAPVAGGHKPFVLSLTGTPSKLTGTIRVDARGGSQSELMLVGQEDARFSCSFDGKVLGRKGMVQLSAIVSQEPQGRMSWTGALHWADGSRSPIVAKPASASQKEADDSGADDPDSKDASGGSGTGASFEVNYPLGAFGRTAPPEQPAFVAFKNATVWTCEAQGVLEHATVLVGAGKILAVGRQVEVPAGAIVVDASGKHITPGIIDCHSHIATDGGVNESGQAISSEVRIGDFIDANDIHIYRQLAGGVTASHILHGSSNPIGGQNQMIKLRWGALPEELKFVEAPPTLKLALGENVKQSNREEPHPARYPQTRMGVEQIIRDAFEAARRYQQTWQAWQRNGKGLPPRRDLELEPLVEVLEGRRWIHCHAYRQDEILVLLRTFEDLGVRVAALQHVLEGYKVADAMARHGAGASAFSDWWAYKFEVYDAIPYNGALMHRAGVLVSFNSDSAELARHLNQEAAKAIKYGGLSAEEALNFVSLYPAKQLMIDRYVGSLKPGKHADLVIWSGPPLSNRSVCEQTWIDGRKYFDRRDDQAMRTEMNQRRAVLVQKILALRKEKQGGKPVPK